METGIYGVIYDEDLIRYIFFYLFEDKYNDKYNYNYNDIGNVRLVSKWFSKNTNRAKMIIGFFEKQLSKLSNITEYRYNTQLENPIRDYLVHCRFKYIDYFLPNCQHSIEYCVNNDCMRKTSHNGIITRNPAVGNIYLQYTTTDNSPDTGQGQGQEQTIINDAYQYYNLHNISTELTIYDISNESIPIYHKKFVPVIQRFIPYCFECMVCYC